MNYGDGVLLLLASGETVKALVARSRTAVPHQNGKAVLGADSKPIAAEEMLDLVYLDPALAEGVVKSATYSEHVEIALAVRQASGSGPGWIGAKTYAEEPAADATADSGAQPQADGNDGGQTIDPGATDTGSEQNAGTDIGDGTEASSTD